MAAGMQLAQFLEVHAVLLTAAGIPSALQPKLFEKLKGEVFDAGTFFGVEEVAVDGGSKRRVVLTADKLGKESEVFLVDHAWSFRLPDARKQLAEVPGLADRMASLMGVVDVAEEADDAADEEPAKDAEAILSAQEAKGEVLWLELDECALTDEQLLDLKLSNRCQNLVGLSLWGCKLQSVAAVLECLAGLHELRALWLNNNPVQELHGAELESSVLEKLRHLEIYNSRLTPCYTSWGLGFCGGVYNPATPGIGGASGEQRHPLWTVHELDLSGRGLQELKAEVVNETEAPVLKMLDLRDNPLEKQNKRDLLGVLASLPSLEELRVSMPGVLGTSVKEIKAALPKLKKVHTDLPRKATDAESGTLPLRLPAWTSEDPIIDRVMRAMWQYVMVYRLATEDKLDETPIWYVMDEFGSAIGHSDLPNVVIAPFMFLPDGTMKSAISYSVVWPLKDLASGDEIFRDYLRGITEEQQRSARLTAWFQTPRAYFKEVHEDYVAKLSNTKLPKADKPPPAQPVAKVPAIRPLKVFTDIPQGVDYLDRPEFVIVEEPSEADIVWAFDQIDEDFRKACNLRPDQFVNQFPYEACLVMKHNLKRTVTAAYGLCPWLQPTYELDSELPALIGDYFTREESGADNLWILKPWNMARSIDTTVTRELPAVIRCMETGPKIAQKYIEKPATFRGRKFDTRWVVLMKSVAPLEVYLYDIFWARFANNPYTTDEKSLDEYETHFTVMNYGGRTMTNIGLYEFVKELEEERNNTVSWSDVEDRVRKLLRGLFEAATTLHPEMHDPQARAVYGADIMFDETLQPKLLEITYCPDTKRACTNDWKRLDGRIMEGKEFYNRLFGCLFLDEEDGFTRL